MTVYISTDSIVESYNELSSMNFKNASILQVFLVLKGINIDKLIYRNTDEIKNRGLEYAQELGSLFSDFEKKIAGYPAILFCLISFNVLDK